MGGGLGPGEVLRHSAARRVDAPGCPASEDKRVLRVIGCYLRVGMVEGGLVSPRAEGTPQGGPLSPLLKVRRPGHMEQPLPISTLHHTGLVSLLDHHRRLACFVNAGYGKPYVR